METDLHRIIYSQQALTDEHVKYFVYQVRYSLNFLIYQWNLFDACLCSICADVEGSEIHPLGVCSTPRFKTFQHSRQF